MTTTFYSYISLKEATASQVVITSSETPLPKPVFGDAISVHAAGPTVAGTIKAVSLDVVQDATGNRSLTYYVTVN